jgi:hypothetical protein
VLALEQILAAAEREAVTGSSSATLAQASKSIAYGGDGWRQGHAAMAARLAAGTGPRARQTVGDGADAGRAAA